MRAITILSVPFTTEQKRLYNELIDGLQRNEVKLQIVDAVSVTQAARWPARVVYIECDDLLLVQMLLVRYAHSSGLRRIAFIRQLDFSTKHIDYDMMDYYNRYGTTIPNGNFNVLFDTGAFLSFRWAAGDNELRQGIHY